MIESNPAGTGSVAVRVISFAGFLKIRIICPGKKFEISDLEFDFSDYLTGDAVISSIIAKRGGMMDMEIYNRN